MTVTSAGFEILEHTADVGIRSWGPSLAATFEQACWGLAEILGARATGTGGTEHVVGAKAGDREALLVDLLNELILLHETKEAAFTEIEIEDVSETELRANVTTLPIAGEAATTGVKAATYHRLSLRETERGFEAEVYLDV